jgi:hypothetical protein
MGGCLQAQAFRERGCIHAAALFLQGEVMVVPPHTGLIAAVA